MSAAARAALEKLDDSASSFESGASAARELALAVPDLAPWIDGPAAGLDEAMALIREARGRLAANPQADVLAVLERALAIGRAAEARLQPVLALAGEALGGSGS